MCHGFFLILKGSSEIWKNLKDFRLQSAAINWAHHYLKPVQNPLSCNVSKQPAPDVQELRSCPPLQKGQQRLQGELGRRRRAGVLQVTARMGHLPWDLHLNGQKACAVGPKKSECCHWAAESRVICIWCEGLCLKLLNLKCTQIVALQKLEVWRHIAVTLIG